MKYAIVKNGTVENIIQLEDGVSIPVDGELVKVLPESIETAQIGATWDGNVFSYISPPKPTPSQDELDMVSRRDSARSKLEGLGLTIDEIQAAFSI